jgi:mono/diheme cytochrome c family protein
LLASTAAVDPGRGVSALRAFAAPVATRFAAADADTLKQGQNLLTEKCGRCHGIGRSDASRDPKAPPLRTLSKRYPVEALEEALGEGVISGHPDMPEFEFDSDDVGAIIAYLKSIQDK